MQNWKNLSVRALEERYDQSKYAANGLEVNQWYRRQSDAVRSELTPERFQYGTTPGEYGYWCRPANAGNDIVVFIHGGAWKSGTADDYLFPARWLTDAGLHYICLNFDNTPVTGGHLFPMVAQLIKAIVWIGDHYGRQGNKPEIHIASHSSGSHLAACLGGLDWVTLAPRYPEMICSLLLCSGIYDLEPVSYSKRREYLELSPLEIFALSPMRHASNPHLRVAMARAEHESPEFVRQHDEFLAKLGAEGVDVRAQVGEGLNHFEILQTFDSPEGFLGRLLMELIGDKR